MKLSITATLTPEEIKILADAKGYNNEGSIEDYVISQYQNMIIDDATKVFTLYKIQTLQTEIQTIKDQVREQVEGSIT